MHTTARRWERAALLLILVIGAWLRFQNIDDIEYNIDQVYPIWQAIQTLDAGALPLVGQGTSVLFANPPLTGYFYVPLIALVRQPVAVYTLTITLNTLAIWLAYRALRSLLGRYPALIGVFLFAVNPWIIEDSRRTWVQALTPFFVTLVFWALAPVLTGRTQHPQRRTLIALVGLALFAHTYLLAFALVAPVSVLIALFWRRIPQRQLVYGALVFAALLSLYGIGLARQWDDTRDRAEQFASGEARLTTEALDHALRLVTGGSYADVRGFAAPQDDAALRQDITRITHALWTATILAGLALALRAVLRPRCAGERDTALILLVWYLLPIAMMSYVSRVVHPFYLLLSVPAGHGLAGWAVVRIGNAVSPVFRRGNSRLAPGRVLKPVPTKIAHTLSVCPLCSLWWAFVLVALIATGAINGLNTLRFAQQTAALPGEDLPFTLPLGEAATLGERIRAARDPGMAVFSEMDEWTPVTLVGHAIHAEQIAGTDRATLIPPDGALTVTFARDMRAPVPPPLYAEPAGAPDVLRDHTVITLWRTTPGAVTIAQPADIPSDIDVRFAGWTLTGNLTPGTTATLDLFWRVDALHPERGIWTFVPFAHLYSGGERVGVFDGTPLPALAWRAGDLLVYRLDVDVPPDAAGPFELRVGLFDAVRTREDGTPGINAIFQVPDGDTVAWQADIVLGDSTGP